MVSQYNVRNIYGIHNLYRHYDRILIVLKLVLGTVTRFRTLYWIIVDFRDYNLV